MKDMTRALALEPAKAEVDSATGGADAEARRAVARKAALLGELGSLPAKTYRAADIPAGDIRLVNVGRTLP